MERSEEAFYTLALIDVHLPDMKGIELLSKAAWYEAENAKNNSYRLSNTAKCGLRLKQRAEAYVMKPFEVEKILQTNREQLKKQEEETSFSEEKVVEFIKTRIKALETTGQTAVAQKK
jgi:DNA-binding NtrC family response regulator